MRTMRSTTSSTPILLFIMTILVALAACGEPPIHASDLDPFIPGEATPTDARFVLEGDYRSAKIDIEEDWIVAHTTVYLWIPTQDESSFEALVKHKDGVLIVGEREIVEDTFIKMEGTLIQTTGQVYLYAEELGYSLAFDGNISTGGSYIEGYFYFQETYDVFADFRPVLNY